MIVSPLTPITFVGANGTTAPADTCPINASVQFGDAVLAVAGHSDTTKTPQFDGTDLSLDNNGTFEAGMSWARAGTAPLNASPLSASVFTPDSLQIHRMRSFAFRSVHSILASPAPTFAASSATVSWPSVTVPSALQGRARMALFCYTTSTNGGPINTPADWELLATNTNIFGLLSKRPVSSFAGLSYTALTTAAPQAKFVVVLG